MIEMESKIFQNLEENGEKFDMLLNLGLHWTWTHSGKQRLITFNRQYLVPAAAALRWDFTLRLVSEQRLGIKKLGNIQTGSAKLE